MKNMNKKIIFLFLFVGGMSLSARADLSAFDKILVKYCVPKNASNCDSGSKATYIESGNYCSCSSGKLYIDRECLTLNCPAGTYLVIDNNTDTCPSGTTRSLYKN